MNALDKAFLRAYTKDHATESARSTAAAVSAPALSAKMPASYRMKAATITISSSASTDPLTSSLGQTETAPTPPAAAAEMKAIQAPEAEDRELYFGDGTWIRVEQSASRDNNTVPAPHIFFATTDLTSSAIEEAARTKSIDSFAPPILKKTSVANPSRLDSAAEQAPPKPHFRNAPAREKRTLGISTTISPIVGKNESPKIETQTPKPFKSEPPKAELSPFVTKIVNTEPATNPATTGVAESRQASSIAQIAPAEQPSARALPEGREAIISAAKPAKVKLIPVWEVDRFLWSEHCVKALAPECDYFREAGNELHKATRSGLKVLSVTSTQRGEGRTLISLCLARAVSVAGARVAIVDADLDNPQLAISLGIEPSCGWEDVVRGELPLEEAAVYSHEDRITLLPISNDQSKRNFSLSDPNVSKMLEQLRAHFDLIILDMGPMGAADRRLFSGGDSCPVDAALVVRDIRLTSNEDAFTAAARLKANGIRSVGIVENFV